MFKPVNFSSHLFSPLIPSLLFSRGSSTKGGHFPRDKTRDKPQRKNQSSSEWLKRQKSDNYVQMAEEKGYRSRAAFKLIELNDKFKFLDPKTKPRVIDLGAAPGGWSQVVADLIEPIPGNLPTDEEAYQFHAYPTPPQPRQKSLSRRNPQLVAIDLLPIAEIPGVSFLQGDLTDPKVELACRCILEQHGADLILADARPNTSGEKSTDHARLMELVSKAFDFALSTLDTGGTFVAKISRGGTEQEFINRIKPLFEKVVTAKPPASRQKSPEIYLVAMGFKHVWPLINIDEIPKVKLQTLPADMEKQIEEDLAEDLESLKIDMDEMYKE